MRYLERIDLKDDPFLLNLLDWERVRVGVAFAHAYRTGYFETKGKRADDQGVLAGSVDTALSNVSQAFRDNDLESPWHDRLGNKHPLLSRLIKGYRRADPATKQQKAATPQLVRKAYELGRGSCKGDAVADLAVGAFFFAMRSCEYSEVTGERKTKIIVKKGVRFFKNK